MCPQIKGIREVALINVEGETDEIFYQKIAKKYLGNVPRRISNLRGNYNIHGKIFDKTLQYLLNNQDKQVRVYCCVDRENRYQNPPLNKKILEEKFFTDKDFKGNVLSVDVIIATQMIESWFFYDMDGIYKFLRVPVKERKPKKFNPVEKLTSYDLSHLFKRYGKVYIKGKKCGYFIESLDIDKIYKKCNDLKNGINLILRKDINE